MAYATTSNHNTLVMNSSGKVIGNSLVMNNSLENRTYTSKVLNDQIFSSLNPTNSSAYMTASMFRNVTVPLICVFGGIGNTMAAVTFLYRKLRQTSCNLYLAMRSLSDTLFLLTLLAVWFDSVEISFFHTQGMCQMIVFMSYVASFLSVWCVTAITFENYIRICHPTKINLFCTMLIAKRFVFVLCIVAIVTYQTSLWTTGVASINGRKMCITYDQFQMIYMITTYIDTIFTLIIPLLVILILSGCIVYSVIKCYRRRVRLRNCLNRNKRNFSSTPQAKVTRLLFGVTIVFVILHTPIHMIKLKMLVNIYILEIVTVNPNEAALKTVFENMYYLNFSANFIVFFVCGQSFRKVFWRLFCNCCLKKKDEFPMPFTNAEQQTDLSLLNLVGKSDSSCVRSNASTTALISL